MKKVMVRFDGLGNGSVLKQNEPLGVVLMIKAVQMVGGRGFNPPPRDDQRPRPVHWMWFVKVMVRLGGFSYKGKPSIKTGVKIINRLVFI